MTKAILLASLALGAIAAAAPLSAADEPAYLSAQLTPGAAGDPKVSGAFEIEVDPEFGDICYSLSAEGAGEEASGRLLDSAGATVLELELTGEDDRACTELDPARAKPLARKPGNYTVLLVTPSHPDGAARGVLAAE